MVIDTSALLAILFKEPERDTFAKALSSAGVRLISTVSVLEAAVVVSTRKGPDGVLELDNFLDEGKCEVVAFTSAQLRLARQAYEAYGKGRHPAGLNLGDCCSYALAQHAAEPLLFKGNDFALTDVARVSWPEAEGPREAIEP